MNTLRGKEDLDLLEKIAGMQGRLKQMEQRRLSTQEEKFIIYPGEVAWWEIDDPEEGRKARRRQYMRMWSRLHPGVRVEATRRSRQRHPDAAPEAKKRYCERHPGRPSEANRRHEERHPGAHAEAVTRYYGTPKGRANMARKTANRRERSTGPDAYAARVELLHIIQEPCAECHAPYTITHQIDHIVALCLGGTDDWSNLQPLCVKCHREKTREDLRRFKEA